MRIVWKTDYAIHNRRRRILLSNVWGVCLMSKELSEYTITAKLLNTYEIKVMATDAAAALASLDDWISDDFEDYLTNQQWDIEAI